MVPAQALEMAVNQLNKFSKKATRVTTVDWRGGYQVKMSWFGGSSLECYVDFKGNKQAREAVIKAVFEKYAEPGSKPHTIYGHGWSFEDFTFSTIQFISVNEVAAFADALGHEYSVLYVQEDISARPVFDVMGIPLVPGEMGKEWVCGQFQPYACSPEACL